MKVRLNTVNDCALFVAKCGQYKEDIDYCCEKYVVDGCSLMGVLSIGLGRDCNVNIHTDDAELSKKFKEEMKVWIVE